MSNLLVTLPLQLFCHLVGTTNCIYENFTSVPGQNSVSVSQPKALPIGYTAFPDVSTAYKWVEVAAPTWNEARKRCILEGANLASPDSFKKIRYAYSVTNGKVQPYLGIHKTYDGHEWTSDRTGLPLTSLPWAPSAHPQDVEKKVTYLNVEGLREDAGDTTGSFICEIILV
ncbi:uncharacterized protein LOC124407988 [Diprion similis]|uniref:uncharacterized protein LOC124407988 n=1 Tax=Diprion similis TaxID=362088 RepID=UPI001EF7F539|nr:uncharacterized protein LOC124407988 [Diprion similis]